MAHDPLDDYKNLIRWTLAVLLILTLIALAEPAYKVFQLYRKGETPADSLLGGE